jgi:outer membrane protein assembly factor BamA
MRRPFAVLSAALAFLIPAVPLSAQKFLPKSIEFKGAPDFTDQELLAAAGLKKGVVLDYAQMNDCSQKLLATGVFSTLAFKFDGQDLIFQLTPAAQLFPIQLTNLPLSAGADVDSRLHAQFPLYHGKVPASGGLADDVRGALEQMLAAEGIKATVMAVAPGGPPGTKNGFVSYSVMAPPVLVGQIGLSVKSATLDAGGQEILTRLTGSPYDQVGTPSQISTYLGNYYRDLGYLEVVAEGVQDGAPVVSADDVRIPFEVTVTPGLQYRLAGVQFAPGVVVEQSDKRAPIHPGDVAAGQQLTSAWQFVSRQYHNRGFMRASVHPVPSFDRAKGVVSYMVSVEPGPQFTMGNLTIENVSDDLRALMMAAWKMPAGSVFNEGAILNYFAIGDANQALKRTFAGANCKFTLSLNDASHTVDVTLRLEKRN